MIYGEPESSDRPGRTAGERELAASIVGMAIVGALVFQFSCRGVTSGPGRWMCPNVERMPVAEESDGAGESDDAENADEPNPDGRDAGSVDADASRADDEAAGQPVNDFDPGAGFGDATAPPPQFTPPILFPTPAEFPLFRPAPTERSVPALPTMEESDRPTQSSPISTAPRAGGYPGDAEPSPSPTSSPTPSAYPGR